MKTTIAMTIALGLSACYAGAEPFLPTELDYSHQDYASYSGQWSWLTCHDIDRAAAQIAAIRHTTDKTLTQANAEIMGTKTGTAPVKRVMMQIAEDAWAVPPAPEGEVEATIADFRDDVVAQCESRHGYPS